MQQLIVSMWPLVLVLAACTHIPPEAVVPVPTATAVPAAGSTSTAPAPGAVMPASAPAVTANSAESAGHARTVKPTAPAATPGKSARTVATKPVAAPAAPPSPVPLTALKPVAAKSPAATALNLATLEQRLRDTRAIGLFTKLSLKNQVDDLLGEFRALYRGKVAFPPAALRQQYDLLMMKVLSLLQDSDAPLAAAIGSSREAIWGILSDPVKLAAI